VTLPVAAGSLAELWFHTGTACNLDCPFCLEGSRPGDTRLGRLSLADVRSLVDTAVALGVRQFSFTGGEPFVVKDMVAMLDYAARFRPCLVLTNGTAPVVRRLAQIRRLAGTPHPIAFRISLDHADEARHDAARGAGNFRLALEALRALHKAGFAVTIARQPDPGRDAAVVDAEFRALFAGQGLPADLGIIALPDYGPPGADRPVAPVPDGQRAARLPLMCSYSRMVVKQDGRLRFYACPLVDDDGRFDLGASLVDALAAPVLPGHHRCYSCARYGWAGSVE